MLRTLFFILLTAMACTVMAADTLLIKTSNDIGYTELLKQELVKSGINITETDLSGSIDTVMPGKSLVIIAGAQRFSADAMETLDSYLKKGGRLLTLGGPAFSEVLYKYNNQWISKEEYLKELKLSTPSAARETILDASDRTFTDKMNRGTNNKEDNVTFSFGDYGLPGSSSQIFCDVPNLIGWENFNYPIAPKMKNATAIAFAAKGDKYTEFLYVEVTDSKGSRWFSSVILSEDWQQYLLTASDFVWWHDSTKTNAAHPDLSDLKQLTMGFAQTGAPIPGGHHTYTISDVELMDLNIKEFKEFKPVELNTIYPKDEVFPVRNAASIKAGTNQIFVKNRNYTLPSEMFSCSPGRQGTGILKNRAMRFIPLIEAYDSKGMHSGYAAWMNVMVSSNKTNGDYEGCITGCFSPQSEDFYNAQGIAAVCEAAKAMLSPALLTEGGTEEYIYVKSKTGSITAGGTFAVFGQNSKDYRLTTALYSGDKLLKEYSADSKKLKNTAADVFSGTSKYSLGNILPDRTVTKLYKGSELIDQIEQSRLVFWSPKSSRHYITTQNGMFMQNGKPINFFGVNYMPSSGIAETDNKQFEHYVCRSAYDPDVIASDLQRIKDIGMNAVSVFIHAAAMDSNNMLDLIDQCDNLGIYVDLSLRSSGDLFYADRKKVRSVINRLQLDKIDNIIAYDTSWEPRIGHYIDKSFVGRQGWDKDWEKWIIDQYGSVKHAEELWNTSVNRDAEGNIIGVTDAMLCDETDKYTKIVSAYRRFIDDHVSGLFTDTYNYYRQVDPNHLVSFRMSMSGSAYSKSGMLPDNFCYDFQSLAPAVSIMEPEGYALNYNDPDSMQQIIFANAYARYTLPEHPVVWKEYGKSMWSGTNFGIKEGFQTDQQNYYEVCLEHMYHAYTSGLFCWYFPGGHRLYENSDYGIINPDGSDRLCTAILRKYAPLFINQPQQKKPDTVINIDRDRTARGIHGIFDEILPKLNNAYAAGRTISFTDSAADYAHTLIGYAVGDTPSKGKYPMKYVNSLVKSVKISPRFSRKAAKITLINTGHAPWQAGTVTVKLGNTEAIIKEDVPYLGECTLELPWSKGTIKTYISGIPFGKGYEVK